MEGSVQPPFNPETEALTVQDFYGENTEQMKNYYTQRREALRNSGAQEAANLQAKLDSKRDQDALFDRSVREDAQRIQRIHDAMVEADTSIKELDKS